MKDLPDRAPRRHRRRRTLAVAVFGTVVASWQGGCSSPQYTSPSAAAQIRILKSESALARNTVDLRQSERNVLGALSNECDVAMAGLTSHRESGLIDDVLWLNIQATRRNVQDFMLSAYSANGRGDSSEVIRLQGYIIEEVRELEALCARFSKQAAPESHKP